MWVIWKTVASQNSCHFHLTHPLENRIFICPESGRTYIATVSKILLLIELKLFSARFGPLGLRNCNKNFVSVCRLSLVCLSSVCLSHVRMQNLSQSQRSQFWSYLYEILVHLCVYGTPRDTEEGFLKFGFFFCFFHQIFCIFAQYTLQ